MLRNLARLVDNGHVEMVISIAAGIIADIHLNRYAPVRTALRNVVTQTLITAAHPATVVAL